MRNRLLALCVVGCLGLGLAVAALQNHTHALAEEVLRLERRNQDLVVAIEALDAEIWKRGLELDAAEVADVARPPAPGGIQ